MLRSINTVQDLLVNSSVFLCSVHVLMMRVVILSKALRLDTACDVSKRGRGLEGKEKEGSSYSLSYQQYSAAHISNQSNTLHIESRETEKLHSWHELDIISTDNALSSLCNTMYHCSLSSIQCSLWFWHITLFLIQIYSIYNIHYYILLHITYIL